MSETSENPAPSVPPSSALDIDKVRSCTEILEAIATDTQVLSKMTADERVRLMMAAGRVVYPDRAQVRRRLKALWGQKRKEKEAKDRVVRASTSIRIGRLDAVFVPPERRLAAPEPSAARLIEDSPAGGQVLRVGEVEVSTSAVSVGPVLQRPRDCYICKKEFVNVHFFYDSMCPSCAEFNYEKRFQTADLTGRVAVITGARLKIGYYSALMMLRAGARVIVTTRFPHDAALRFIREKDFELWRSRVHVHGLDLRHSPSVEAFAQFIEAKVDRLDILINNAAQTVRRPPGFYQHLMDIEARPIDELPKDAREVLAQHEELKRVVREAARSATSAGDRGRGENAEGSRLAGVSAVGLLASAELSQIAYSCDEMPTQKLFPIGQLDADLQQVDRRQMNSWRMTLADVPTAELLEVQLVNSIAPFILCSKLKPLMMRDRTDQKHIVNVSAMEGKFNRHTKTDRHPHTNMAKAALNMMTLTSARDYVKSGIYMNAVDTGWVTDEDPHELSVRKQEEHDFQPPLDIIDGAARVCDPFFSGILTGKHSWGNFLKDYYPTEW